MNVTGYRLAAVAILLLVAGAVVALVGRGDKGGSASPPPAASPSSVTTPSVAPSGCLPLPVHRATPSWFPSDLPLPDGSYATDLPFRAVPPYEQALFIVPRSLRDFVVYVVDEWPKKGWKLGWGDAEPFEAEDRFYDPSNRRLGAFRARSSVLCDSRWTWVLIALGADRAPGPTP